MFLYRKGQIARLANFFFRTSRNSQYRTMPRKMRQASSCSQILPRRIWQSNYSIVPPNFQFVGDRFFKNSKYFAGNACFEMCFDLHFYSFRPLYQVWESETVIALESDSTLYRETVSCMNSKSFSPFSRPLVDHVGLWRSKHHKPVEFLLDLKLDFQDCNKLRVMRVSFMGFFKKKQFPV